MKICPICQTTFDGDESFCAHDGTPLQPQGAYAPGHLAGSNLDGRVRLDSFRFADHFGERYRGHLLEEDTPVDITVTYRRIAATDIEQLQESLGKLQWPSALLDIHSVQVEKTMRYIIEESPPGDSLQRILDKSGPMAWTDAIALTVRVARILEWLADAGLAHRSLHPRFIYLDGDHVRIGHWLPGLLHADLPPIDTTTPAASVPVYPAFCPPEWVDPDSDHGDIGCAHTYLVGAVLHAALGQPLVDDPSQAELHQWPQSPPTKDHRFELPDGAPEALEALATMLVNANPDRRFDSPTPAINALSSLIDEDPNDLAPPLDATNAPALTIAVGPSDLEQTVSTTDGDEPEGPAKTQLGLPTQAPDDGDEDGGQDSSDTQPRVITEAGDTDHDPDDAPDTVEGQKKTQLMGAVSAADLAAYDAQRDDGETDDSDDDSPSGGTDTSHHAVDLQDEPSEEEDDPPADEDEDDVGGGTDTTHEAIDRSDDDPQDSAEDSDETDASDQSPSDSNGKTEMSHGAVNLDDGQDAADDDSESADDDSESDDDDADEIYDDSEHSRDDQDDEDDRDDDEDDEDDEPQEETSDDGFQVGYVQANNDATGDVEDPFFTRSTQEVWDQDIYRESKEQSERAARITRIAMVVGGILIVVGAFVAFQTDLIFSEETEDDATAVAPEDDADGLDDVEIDMIEDRFQRGLEREEFLAPRERSALEALSQLEDHIGEDRYNGLVDQFLEAALPVSEEMEADENYRDALRLVRAANDLRSSPELEERIDDLDDALRAQRDNDDANSDDDDEAEDEEASNSSPPTDDDSRPQHAQASNNSGSSATSNDDHSQTIDDARDAISNREYSRATNLLSTVLDEDPDHAAANATMGNAYFNQGQHQQALTFQQRAVEQAPDNTEYRKQLGTTHFRLSQYQEAHDIWEDVLQDDPSDAEAQVFLDRVERRLN